jgi:hypothetical protein
MYRDSKAVSFKEYFDCSQISAYIDKSGYILRNDRDYKDVDYWKARKRHVVIESLDLTRNINWLESCFSKIKKPNSHCLGNQSGIAGVHNFIFIIVIV